MYKYMTPEIIFGNGALEKSGESCLRLGAKRVLIVSDPGLQESGWTNKIEQCCEDIDLPYSRFYGAGINPRDVEVEQGVDAYKQAGCDAVLGLGGGSALDVAKGISILATNGGRIADYEGVDLIAKPLPPLVMVTTTAGSGSEVSQFSIIIDSKRRKKMTIVSKSLIPDIAIIDPVLLSTKSSSLTASTGMDVLSHAIESFVSLAATPLTDVQALHAIKLVSYYLRPSVAAKSNVYAKEQMAMASLQAGLAFSNAILGAVHAISHAIGGRLSLAHGDINSILLPHVMNFNRIAAPERFKQIAEQMGITTAHRTADECALLAVELVTKLGADVRAPQRLADIGVEREDFSVIADMAMEDACMVTNPRDITKQDVLDILHEAY
ncbi:iron-containing alcohol dehydrogenase [Alkalicoccus luteus]|uniref:Iron-containing alcohol dehydrogenase n=1 Tax=Alkalicoccus luteus TaxID=1237094 RepID=A0A969PL58_9BACI|nr:iron-containing alcohol dehydrogenase [Alkalicoccus luteus]NJP36177.1 iron-containing alcohol dehydrogenase [Alkalicoccus luteus]